MIQVGAISYGAGAVMFLVITLLLVTSWPGRVQGALLVAACAVSAIWCAVVAVHAVYAMPSFRLVEVVEIWRDALWLAFLFGVLRHAAEAAERGTGSLSRWRLAGHLVIWLCVAAAAMLLLQPLVGDLGYDASDWGSAALFVHLLLAVAGLALVEQLFRNTRSEHRWAIKFLCFGLGGMFAYDLYLYAHGLLFNQLSLELWQARGAVNAMVVPLIALSAARNPEWKLDIFVSRHIVFHSAALLGAGVYLILMAAAGYYIRLYGGSWGGVAQVTFLFGAVLLLLTLVSSGRLRGQARVFLSKHFFRNKYDYREEWLRFTRILSTSGGDAELRENIIRAIAEILGSPAGAMWVRKDGGFFHLVSRWNMPPCATVTEPASASLVRFLETTGWVIFLDEYERDASRYPGLEPPGWLREARDPWVIVPLTLKDELLGFVLLSRAKVERALDWEDSDLLKTVGREAASYLALLKLSEALTDARQFEAFNRLSSYVVHDLKNLVAQLSLVVSNARKHMHNPEFVADAVTTVENASVKMNRLLGQLRKGQVEARSARRVALEPALREVASARAAMAPAPRLEAADAGLAVVTDPDRLTAVVEHLVQNAQEATPADGEVVVRLARDGQWAVIEVADTGCGMDEDFISERLFRPFDTTKGNAGMGIGVYESREFVQANGGTLDVASEPGGGTAFRLRLPAVASTPLAGPGGPEAEDDAGVKDSKVGVAG